MKLMPSLDSGYRGGKPDSGKSLPEESMVKESAQHESVVKLAAHALT